MFAIADYRIFYLLGSLLKLAVQSGAHTSEVLALCFCALQLRFQRFLQLSIKSSARIGEVIMLVFDPFIPHRDFVSKFAHYVCTNTGEVSLNVATHCGEVSMVLPHCFAKVVCALLLLSCTF